MNLTRNATILWAVSVVVALGLGFVFGLGVASFRTGPAPTGQVRAVAAPTTTARQPQPAGQAPGQSRTQPGQLGVPAPVPSAPQATMQPGARAGTGTLGAPGAANQGNAQNVVFEVDERTITQEAQATVVGQDVGETPLGRATVQSIDVVLENGEVVANGQAKVGALTMPYSVVGTVNVMNGRPVVRVTQARAGGFGMPASTVQGIEQTLQSQLDQLLAQERMRVRSVTIQNGKMRVVGTQQ